MVRAAPNARARRPRRRSGLTAHAGPRISRRPTSLARRSARFRSRVLICTPGNDRPVHRPAPSSRKSGS